MSNQIHTRAGPTPRKVLPLLQGLADEGFRLFFPLTALHAALWPFLWVAVWSFDLPLSRQLPPSLWHMHEMIIGSWGAALIGFLTTAAPEWTDTPRLRGRPLWILAAFWAIARVIGLIGNEALIGLAGVSDLAWMVGLILYLVRISHVRRSDRLIAFIAWLFALTVAAAGSRIGMVLADYEFARRCALLAGFVFLGLLGLALARITVPVTNTILDPTEASAPFRPHPGRLNLAPGLMAIAIAGDCWGVSPAISGYLWIAAGAAFMDRVAESFVGRHAFRTEIMMIAGASMLSGAGLILLGISRLKAPWAEASPLHLTFMGGLGLGVLAVMSIAGRFHTSQGLGLNRATKLAFALILVSTLLRVLPDIVQLPWPSRVPHLVASVLWASAFAVWLWDYWPSLSRLESGTR